MKGPILPILVVALILGGAYYYFFVMKKGQVEETPDKQPDKKPEPVRLIGNMFEPDHSSEAIAAMFSGEEWRKKNPILI